MLHAVKMADGTDDVLEGLGIPFDGPFSGKDIDGERFTKNTDLCLEWFAPGDRPLLWHHGRDADAGTAVVGRVVDYKSIDTGVWTKVQLDRQSEYFDAIKQLVAAGKLYFSSGAMGHLVQKKKSGEITVWPWIELSATTTPANLFAEIDFATAEDHFAKAGIKSAKLDEIKAMTEGSDTSGGYNVSDNSVGAHGRGEFAYVDKNGRGHLPIHDAAHVRAALARFNQTQFESDSAKQAAKRKILAAAKRMGVEVADDDNASKAGAIEDDTTESRKRSDRDFYMGNHAVALKDLPDGPTLMGDMDGGPYPEGSYEDLATDIADELQKFTMGYAYVCATFPGYCIARCCDDMDGMQYYRVAYDLDEHGEPVLGSMEKVEPAMVPSAKSGDLPIPQSDEAPLTVKATRLSEYAALVADDTKDLSERRTKEGRVLSGSNRERLTSAVTVLQDAVKAIQDLLDASVPQPAKAATEDRTAELRKRRERDFEALRLFGETLAPAA